jgi:asparagine synthase (glutamine-hydrolysing)
VSWNAAERDGRNETIYMSVIFGVCAAQNSIVGEKGLLDLAEATARYGVDGTDFHVNGRLGMGYQAFHTHQRSRLGRQPTIDLAGNVVTCDGRLDNHHELAARLEVDDKSVSDTVIILKAFECWGDSCFSQFIGDWALSLWIERERVLYLARDHAGTRTLFYSNQNGEIRWSTYLETFLAEARTPDLDREYMARLLAAQEIGDLTPYKGVRAVTPAHYLAIRDGKVTARPHWHWIADTNIVYKSDAEYDENFLFLLRTAVQRRDVPGAERLAELSGGVDSTSIVCIADKIVEEGSGRLDSIDTVSYFDDTEPDWNERPYVTAIEKHRGKEGVYIDCSMRVPSYEPLMLPDRIYPYPGCDRISLELARQFDEAVAAKKYRVILSGIGGDELLGGVPTPMPELANHLRAGRLIPLLQRTALWSKAKRQPFVMTLSHALAFTAQLYRPIAIYHETVPPWLTDDLRSFALSPHPLQLYSRDRLRARPSAIASGLAWWSILETLHHSPNLLNCYEYRYPYLDRDLVGFLHRIPREQLVQPGRRRLLMRRALRNIVPTEVLERKRKAYMSHGSIAMLRSAQEKIEKLFSNSLMVDYGFVDQDRLLKALRSEVVGELKWTQALTKAIGVELWLRSLEASRLTPQFRSNGTRSTQDMLVPSRANRIRVDVAGA